MCNEVLHHCARGWDTSAPRVAVPTPQCRALLLKVSSCVSSPWLQAGAWDDDLGFVGTAKSQARKYRLGGNFVCKCREFFDSETNRIYANALWCARARIPAHICTNICTSIHPSIHKSIHPSIHPSIHTHVLTYVCMYIHACRYLFVHFFIYRFLSLCQGALTYFSARAYKQRQMHLWWGQIEREATHRRAERCERKFRRIEMHRKRQLSQKLWNP